MHTHSSGGTKKNQGRSKFDKGLALTFLTGMALLLAVGVVFSVAHGSRRITTAANDLYQTSESLRSATVVRAQLAIAVFMGTVGELDEDTIYTGAAMDASTEGAAEALTDLADGVASLDAEKALDGTDIRPHADDLFAVSNDILTLLAAGEMEAARELSNSVLDPTYETLAADFIGLRDALTEEVRTSDVLLGRIGNVARFLVAFFIPASVIVVYRELVIRRQKELELEHRLENERQLARAREEFVANASHELRTPLTGIAGMAMLLEEELGIAGSDLSRELVDVIIRESSDLARIVEDLLTTARLDAGALHFSFEDVSVLEEISEATAGLLRAGIEVTSDCESALVRADRTRLRQIVRNLLSNAGKYGGPNIRIAGARHGQSYVLLVADDGDGLPALVEEKLFERFVHRTADSARTDSVGLGLSIVHALVVGMGGAITYEHRHGESQFTIRLPLSQADGAATAGPPIESVPARATGTLLRSDDG